MRIPKLPISLPLVTALLAGLLVWLTAPARSSLLAEPRLPWADPRSAGAGALGEERGRFRLPREPMALALLRGGDLLVADTGPGKLFRFSPDGRLRGTYSGRGGLQYPVGLAAGEDDRVWVADLWQRRVYRLDLDRDALTELPPELADYQEPAGLAYRDGLLYLADVGRQQVLVLDARGGLVRAVGSGPGREPGQLDHPNAVWVSGAGDIFVADSNNARIQVFNSRGRLQRILQPDRLLQPRGVVEDARGRLLVADSLSHDVVILDPAGNLLARYGESEQLQWPTGLALHGNRLFVADRGNNRVVSWELGDE